LSIPNTDYQQQSIGIWQNVHARCLFSILQQKMSISILKMAVHTLFFSGTFVFSINNEKRNPQEDFQFNIVFSFYLESKSHG
jgi:hypothetical protein